MKPLVIIPARGGSKGIPHKNIKLLGGKPLICYAIDVARRVADDAMICVTTDDDAIIEVVAKYGLKVPFKRPAELATDGAGTNGVLIHALSFYENRGCEVDAVVLLQPTSPFRRVRDVTKAMAEYDGGIDMVTTVMPAKCNPYYDCFEDTSEGLLSISKGDGKIERRQDAPRAWQQNGAVYVINPHSLKEKGLSGMDKIRKSVMDVEHSIDLDSELDWKVAELMLADKVVQLD